MNELLELRYHLLDAWLGGCVVVMYTIEELGETPERVRFNER